MKKNIIFCMMTLLAAPGFTQPLPDYYTRTRFLFAPPAVFGDGLLGFANPANLALLAKPEIRFAWSTEDSRPATLQNWGLFTAIPHLGFSVQRQKFQGIGVSDFKLSTALGSQALSLGVAYGWSAGKNHASGRTKLLTVASIVRPSKYLSAGITGNFSLESSAREGVASLGIRPLGSPALTLFGDAALQKGTDLEDLPWSVGAVLQPAAGIHIIGRYFKSQAFTLGAALNFGRSGVSTQSHFDADSRYELQTYMVRSGGDKPSVIRETMTRRKRYLRMRLKGRVDYLKYTFLDAGTRPLFQILTDIAAAKTDPRIQALALNLSAMRIRPEHAWEVRRALQSFRDAGKQVVIFIDNVRMTGYHLASVADVIALDPLGSVLLQGYALGKTYFKGTLEKLGLGFDAWRFLKYKSAAEVLSRDSMSVADREQLQDYVDDWYAVTREEVCGSRHFTPEQFDRIVDEQTYFDARHALQSGLVDTLARWSELDGVLADLTKAKLKPLAAKRLLQNALPQQNWGPQPQIAVIYALGVCAMDEGIKARWLEGVFRVVSHNPAIKAVVLRVDSPGGDGMASDVVAEAIKKCRRFKPVVISQGQVAASGGYWLSMYGDAILAGPNTVTGSIGVIFGWLYDKGFGKKVGLTSDLVKKGRHADLGMGVQIPLLNLQVPARNLTEAEKKRARDIILKYYDQFVQKVAEGRGLTVERVKELAEGHVYSGKTGKRLQLVDEIGGLQDAIRLARERAGLAENEDIGIIEIPKSKGLVNLKNKISPLGVTANELSLLRFLRFMAGQNGKSTAIIQPGMYPEPE